LLSGYLVKRRFRRFSWAIILATLIAGLSCAYIAQRVAGDRAFAELKRSANETLALQAETLGGLLEKYRLLPPLLSRRDDIRAVFRNHSSSAIRKLATEKALEIAGFSGAMDVAFADPQGRIFASARDMFIASADQRSTLIEAARQHRLGREAVSSADGEPSYVFASSVNDGDVLLGVVAVYVRFDQIEATWSLAGNPIAATDASGRVFLANTKLLFTQDWHGRVLNSIEANDRPVLFDLPGKRPGVYRVKETGELFLETKRDLPLLNWTLHVFTDYGPVGAAEQAAAMIAGLTSILAGFAAWVLVKRRENYVTRTRRDQATALRLERLVRDRTRELTREVEERKRTELQLRATQAELIQAAKLAALGQMSAALSHEFNQPLAAISAQAENAGKLIERGQAGKAADAVSRIAGIVGRMSELSRSLLTFARKPGTATAPVLLRPIIDEAMVLAGPKAKKGDVIVDYSGVPAGLKVYGGRIRLTQVFVNLVSNAIDAINGSGSAFDPGRRYVRINAQETGTEVVITVEDNGPGIDEEDQLRIFDPFYTTKEVGEGLGIGLSVVFNIVKELGGRIFVSEGSLPGACFEIHLPSVDEGAGKVRGEVLSVQ
jgi:two-component system C4-dicarboxylate transport sensor histidine kinase DctB